MTTATQPETKTAFQIAREALSLVGQYGTPPTPDVYEVWYRYVAGIDAESLAELRYAVEEANSVSIELLKSLHVQLSASQNFASIKVSSALAEEIQNFQNLVSDQKSAGCEFAESIDAANSVLSSSNSSQDALAQCIASLNAGSNKMQVQLEQTARKLNEAQRQVDALQNELAESQRSLMVDHLTGVGNRRKFDALVRQYLGKPVESQLQHYLILIDMDRFKTINDTFGHQAGDQLIQFLATQVQRVYPDVPIARLGGDEFAIFLETESRDAAVSFTDHLREHFRGQPIQVADGPESIGRITFSMGAARRRDSDDESTWYTRADKLLYKAKELGRDRAVVESSK